jgi:hypothetical protein
MVAEWSICVLAEDDVNVRFARHERRLSANRNFRSGHEALIRRSSGIGHFETFDPWA